MSDYSLPFTFDTVVATRTPINILYSELRQLSTSESNSEKELMTIVMAYIEAVLS